MHPVDYSIVLLYTLGLLFMGFWLARKAGRSSNDYFLGNNRLPWWALGASGMSSNLDVAGTMTIVTLIYLFGLHGFFIEMRGGVVLPIAIFLAFMGKWHRRSGVMTTAEWMIFRFGKGWQGQSARFFAAGTYLILTIGMVVFFLSAAGLFLSEFLPFSPTQCILGMALVALIYTLLSGLYGVIWTDVIQSFLIGGAALYIAVMAFFLVTPELLERWPGAELNTFFPQMENAALGEYSIFWFFLLIWVSKALLEGFGGSGGSAYMAQRFYAARTDAECSKLAMLWTLLFSFRWPMVLGLAILALHLGLEFRDLQEAERILPQVLQSEFFPVGVLGLVLAALLAAAMSTFDSTVNAGASYVVRDGFEVLFPTAGERAKVWAGYVASFLMVAIGVGLTLLIEASVVEIWVTIVLLLFPSFLVPFALRWLWQRFNGAGFSLGVLSGFAAALTVLLVGEAIFQSLFLPAEWANEAGYFILISLVSLGGSLIGTWVSAPGDPATLRKFYQRVRPLGLWPRDWKAKGKTPTDRQDLLRLALALPWQILTFLIPMGVLLRMWSSVVPAIIIWGLLFWILWRLVKKQEIESECN